MNAAVLPAPLHLRLASSKSLSAADAQRALAHFLAVDAPAVLANSGGAAVARSNLARLAEALRDELADSKPELKSEPDEGGKKKRRKRELKKDGEGKRRKVAGDA